MLKKVSNGKTIKVDLVIDNGDLIENVVISGDFFLHPEEYIHLIEESIRGRSLKDAINKLNEFRGKVELLGATFDDIADLLNEAYQKATYVGRIHS